jgi:hypothetical protein
VPVPSDLASKTERVEIEKITRKNTSFSVIHVCCIHYEGSKKMCSLPLTEKILYENHG